LTVSDRSTRPDPSAAFLDLYKLTVEMADRISARRATANSFFLTLHAALVTLIGFVRPTQTDTKTHQVDTFGVVYVAIGGLVLAATWWVLLRSFRDLNRAKFKVIGDMEARLPAEPFNDEWKYLKGDPVPWWRKRYAELGTVERFVPFVFAAIYVAAIIRFT
jgi:hypothetical protein